MKALICREEALCESVPSVTEFVDLVRTNRVGVRKRNQLHASWGEGVESRQLVRRRQSERKRERLDTVAEEIAAGDNVAGIEILIDLRDETGQVVERRRDPTEALGPLRQPSPRMDPRQIRSGPGFLAASSAAMTGLVASAGLNAPLRTGTVWERSRRSLLQPAPLSFVVCDRRTSCLSRSGRPTDAPN